ncbi:DNA primase [Haloferula helveola]|uniref:DNA primase n=1 Tax=Haloferula helveola TaxID=490095 RepID=A0ABM7RL46_9BACT|nr:DNA primase [Haloferula helveola]
MPQIPRETVEQVLAATDIVDLISSYGFTVKRAGSRFVTLCPFHNEKSPSFSIDPVRQFFHCFGCKKSGDAIHFVREHENLTFIDAVKKLASRASIPIVEEAVDPKEERARRDRGRLLDLHREVSRFFHSLLLKSPDAAHAREYLKSRGFGKEMAERWEIGWAPESARTFLDWAREKGVRGRDLVNSGLAIQRDSGGLYIRFRDRLMFPIRNDHGDVIAFSGRQLREDPRSGKYINSPETTLFKKSNVLFALDRSRKGIMNEKAVLLCEGQIDAIACHEQGIENAIAPLGTAFTPQHAKILKRYTKQALLCFDADSAGYTAAERAFRELAGEDFSVRVVRMPPGEDPDSFMQKNGTDAFRALLGEALNFFDFKIEHAKSNGGLSGPQERAAFTRDCAELLSVVSDAVSRDAMINHVATRLRTGVPELRSAVADVARKGATRRKFERRREEEPEPAAVVEPVPLDRRIGTLCALALHSTEARDWLAEQFENIHEIEKQLEGVAILRAILSARPDPTSPASINSFLSGLPEGQRLALQQEPSFSENLPDDPVTSAEQTLADASALALEKEDAQIKAALNDPDLGIEEQIKLLQRAKEIAELIGGLQGRALTTDRFAPSARGKRSENPWKKGDFRDERKP